MSDILSSWSGSHVPASTTATSSITSTTPLTSTVTTVTTPTNSSSTRFVEMEQTSTQFPESLQFGHGNNPLPTFTTQPEEKWFRVLGSFDGIKVQRHDILCKKDEIGNFFDKVAKKFQVKPRDRNHMKIKYFIKVKDQEKLEEHIIVNDEDLEATAKLCYSLCPEYTELQIFVEKSKSPARRKRPCEMKGSSLKSFVVVNKRYYENMSVEVAKKYLKCAAYIRYLMGVEDENANNLINPTTFICHVKDCMEVKTLGDIGNFLMVLSHWKDHSLGVNSDKSCEILFRRHNYLTQVKGKSPWKRIFYYQTEDLELALDDARTSLAIRDLTRDAFFPTKQRTFAGSSLMLEIDIVKKLAVADPTALDDMEEPHFGSSSSS